jgi:hypothetical protein
MPTACYFAPVIVADGKYRPTDRQGKPPSTDAEAAAYEAAALQVLEDVNSSSTVAKIVTNEINSVGPRKDKDPNYEDDGRGGRPGDRRAAWRDDKGPNARKDGPGRTHGKTPADPWVRLVVPYVGMTWSVETQSTDRIAAYNPDDDVLYRGDDDDPTTNEDERRGVWLRGKRADQPAWKDRRGGSASVIYFDPSGKDVAKSLVHELFHAVRNMYGLVNPIPTVTPLYDFQNEEEFFAMLVGNIYLSEVGRSDLRASHQTYKELDPKRRTSAGFLTADDFGRATRALLAKLRLQMPGLFESLATAVSPQVAFNPVREFRDNP